jgi:hypothetical protein
LHGILFLLPVCCVSQPAASAVTNANKTTKIVSFITTLHSANATKDGIYLNGYVVAITSDKISQLDGKRIQVTGKVSFIKGFTTKPGEPEVQARAGDYKCIRSPKIKIIKQ